MSSYMVSGSPYQNKNTAESGPVSPSMTTPTPSRIPSAADSAGRRQYEATTGCILLDGRANTPIEPAWYDDGDCPDPVTGTSPYAPTSPSYVPEMDPGPEELPGCGHADSGDDEEEGAPPPAKRARRPSTTKDDE